MRSFVYLLFLCSLLAACSDPKQALDTWVHADTGSYGAAISPDRKHLLTGDIDGFARVWDLQKNKVLYSVQHEEGSEGGIVSAAFSASSGVLVTVEQNSIARWAVDSGRLTGYWSWPKLTDVAVSATILDLKLDTNAKTPTFPGLNARGQTTFSPKLSTFARKAPKNVL